MRLIFLAILAAATILAGCSSDDSTSNTGGTLHVLLTDKPIELDQVWVTITEIEVHQTGGNWKSISNSADTLDLLTLKNNESLISSANLNDGNYTGLRLLVSDGHVVDGDNQECQLKIPSGKIEVPVNFEIQSGKVTSVLLDFNADKSVHVTQAGNTEQCILRPVITPVSVKND